MPASKAEQVLDALKALLEAVPDAVVERNSALPETAAGRMLTVTLTNDLDGPVYL
jgi:hypothetical protein